MKHLFITLALALMALTARATTPDDLFAKFKNVQNASYVHLPKVMLKAGLAMTGIGDDDDFAGRLNSITVLSLDECDDKVKADFASAVSKLDMRDFEPMVKSTNDGSDVSILTKTSKGKIKEILVISLDSGDADLVLIKGNIRPSDLGKVMKYSK